MIDIAFTESAAGGLVLAQSFGKGKYGGGCIGVILHHEDGSEPTQEEIEAAQTRAEKQHRSSWENAVPLGGRAGDVFNFSLGLSFGDIRNPLSIEDRLEAVRILYSFWNDQIAADEHQHLNEVAVRLTELKSRIAAGEDARIWYSDTPDEQCGFYWLMDELRNLPEGHGTLFAIEQPAIEEKENVLITHNGWGEVEPGQFGTYLHLACPVSDLKRSWYANQWKELQRENALIRAKINGKLRSAPDNLYDGFIRQELALQAEEFKEAIVVGNVLGKHQLGICDGYIHFRIQNMVADGSLIALTEPGDDEPGYWRILKKA